MLSSSRFPATRQRLSQRGRGVESLLSRAKVRAVGRATGPREADAFPRLCVVSTLEPSALPAIGFSSCDQLEACGPGRAWEACLPKQTPGLQGRGIPPGEARQVFLCPAFLPARLDTLGCSPALGFPRRDSVSHRGDDAWRACSSKPESTLWDGPAGPGEADAPSFVIFVNFVVKSCAAVRPCPWQLRGSPW
jgi:hypothetical protein